MKIDENELEKDFKMMQKLENQLGKISKDTTGKVPLSELQTQIPSIDFERILKSFKNDEKLRENAFSPVSDYFWSSKKNLEHVLKKTPPRVLANFLIIRFIAFSTEFFRTEPDKPNTLSYCADFVIHMLPRAALRVYVHNHFDRENKEHVSRMLESIRDSYVQMFNSSTWLHPKTKESAIRKLTHLRKVIGYPDEFEPQGTLDKIFEESLDIKSTDSFYTFSRKVARFRTEQLLESSMGGAVMTSNYDVLGVNAAYWALRNSFVITVPFLDEPFFDATLPKYVRLASVGSVMAHEIGHAFDTDGRNFDENGKKESDLWTREDTAEYDRKAQCLVDQYNEYDDPVYGRKMNGTKTLEEMLADRMGVEATWRSLKAEDLSGEASLIGFEGVPFEKMFFRVMAMNFCATRDRLPLEIILEKKPHPSASFRANGILSNLHQFGAAFKCPVGSPMNPAKKCTFL
ncbi:unnamed protein product [Caenorhabditis sp. 36 PRJEB53466]|nr:unnamed protein product [Caenorhabditis sp. 36 PRJEB53466]